MFGKVPKRPSGNDILFIHAAPMGLRKSMGIGLRSITVKAMAYILSRVFSSITKARGGDWNFVTRKISHAVASIKLGLSKELTWGTWMPAGTGVLPGNMFRPCGKCSSRKTPEDFVIGTGETHSVRELLIWHSA